MHELPILLQDIILILVVVAAMTYISKKINLPLIIGYILAGFIVGPVVNIVPTVTQTEVVDVLSDIGVIFLMFGLGLGFSLHKFLEVGKTCGVAAVAQIIGMIAAGFGVGQLLGWSPIDSVFAGMMLAMSSTVITIKVISDAGMSNQKFAYLSTGTLIIEDVLTIFMMVIVSALAAKSAVSGAQASGIVVSLVTLLIYLALWLFLGIYLLPTMFRKGQKMLNNETLLMWTLGICFGMVWLANYLGFSSELGAFLAGSIFACTIQAPSVEKLIAPCKDLFGVIFFVSVGMLIDPVTLSENWVAILALAAVDIIGDFIILFVAMNATGQDLYTTLHCATCQAQIGEFSFVIAGLGIALGLTSAFLYPVIIAVSVLTIMMSPFMLRLAKPLYKFCNKVLPEKNLRKLNHEDKKPPKEIEGDRDLAAFLKEYAGSALIYAVIIVGLCMIGDNFIIPALATFMPALWASAAVCVVVFLLMSPFFAPILIVRKRYYVALRQKHTTKNWILDFLVGLRVVFGVVLLSLPFTVLLDLPVYISLPLAAFVAFVVFKSKHFFMGIYMQVHIQFMTNLNEKQLAEEQENNGRHAWLAKRLFVAEFTCAPGCGAVSKNLIQLDLGRRWHLTIIKILRDGEHINIPNARETVRVGDIIHVTGEAKDLDNFEAFIKKSSLLAPAEAPRRSMREYIEFQSCYDRKDRLVCAKMKLDKNSPLVNTSVLNSNIKEYWNSYFIAVERGFYPIVKPRSSMVFRCDDYLWAVGPEMSKPDFFVLESEEKDLDYFGTVAANAEVSASAHSLH